jgi:hypothetical protein
VKVELYGYVPGRGAGNILFPQKYPMRGGVFPKSHPCASNPMPMCLLRAQRDVVPEEGTPPLGDDALSKFRALGYEASCFPEGDGICFYPPSDKDPKQVPEDVASCFGWHVIVRRL